MTHNRLKHHRDHACGHAPATKPVPTSLTYLAMSGIMLGKGSHNLLLAIAKAVVPGLSGEVVVDSLQDALSKTHGAWGTSLRYSRAWGGPKATPRRESQVMGTSSRG